MAAQLHYPDGYIPQRAILYCRISDARDRDGQVTTSGVEDQERRLRLHFESVLGWGILIVLVENDTSAFKRRRVRLPDGRTGLRVVRPKYRHALDLLASGEADGFAALDLDRAMRDPRDLEDMIDIVEDTNVLVKSVTGSLSLDTDAGITMARVMVTMANKSSRDASRRLKEKAEAKALAGEWGGGPRPFGFEPDGITIRQAEAELIREGSEMVLEDVSIYAQVRDLRAAGVESSMGKRMSTQAWRQILMRPRNAGILAHNSDEIGPAPWPPIVEREVWESVREKLERDEPGEASVRRWFGHGIYLCGRCGAPMMTGASGHRVGAHRVRAYRCSAEAHLSRAAAALDAYIEDIVIARLSRPDAASLLQPLTSGADAIDVKATRQRVRALRETVRELASDRALGLITREEHLRGRDTAQAEITKLERALTSTITSSPTAKLIAAEDVAAAWDELGLGVHRAVIREIMTVTVNPARRGRLPKGVTLDESAIQIDWVSSPRRPMGVPHVSSEA